jgi:hypothetical protein
VNPKDDLATWLGTSWPTLGDGEESPIRAIITAAKFPTIVFNYPSHAIELFATTNGSKPFARSHKAKTQTCVEKTRSAIIAIVSPGVASHANWLPALGPV